VSKKYKEPSCEFYIKKYPEYLSDFLLPANSIALPINAYDQGLRKNVPKEDQELFIAYLYIENLIKQILHHHFDGIRSFRFDGEEFPFIQIGPSLVQPHPNVIYTTKEALSLEEWSEIVNLSRKASSNRAMPERIKIIRETTTLSNDQKAVINNRLNYVIRSMKIKFWLSERKTSLSELVMTQTFHHLPELHEHIAEEMGVAVDPDCGQPVLDNFIDL